MRRRKLPAYDREIDLLLPFGGGETRRDIPNFDGARGEGIVVGNELVPSFVPDL